MMKEAKLKGLLMHSEASPKLKLLINGAAIGLDTLTGFQFDPKKDHAYCRICGCVYQTDYDRSPELFKDSIEFAGSIFLLGRYAESLRNHWSLRHSNTHSDQEHRHLALSGEWLTPEAAHKLAGFGIIDVAGSVTNPEIEAAYRESSPVPTNDAEGT